MTAFLYQAVPISGGKAKSGQIDADTPRHARNLLREQGLLTIKLTESAAAHGQSARLSLSSQQLATLTRQFSALLDAGLTIDELLIVLCGSNVVTYSSSSSSAIASTIPPQCDLISDHAFLLPACILSKSAGASATNAYTEYGAGFFFSVH